MRAAGTKMNPDELFVDLLTSKRYRILRHTMFLLFLLCLGIGNMYVRPEDQWEWLVVVTVLIISPILLNVYVLVPRLLLRNRSYIYVAVTIILIISVLGISTYIQYTFNIPSLIYNEDYGSLLKYIMLSNISTAISFSFILAGTTSVHVLQLWLREKQRISQLEETSAVAELDMLRSQINPHFLFNMLNNAIVQTREDPCQARETILKLKDMLDYQFATSHAHGIALREDINFLNDLLHLEKLRRDRFDYRILVQGDTDSVEVPPLLFIPFVENAIKHGNDNTRESYILIIFLADKDKLHFFCTNSIPVHSSTRQAGGLGLRNIRRRMELIYGKEHTLNIDSNGKTYNVNLTFKI